MRKTSAMSILLLTNQMHFNFFKDFKSVIQQPQYSLRWDIGSKHSLQFSLSSLYFGWLYRLTFPSCRICHFCYNNFPIQKLALRLRLRFSLVVSLHGRMGGGIIGFLLQLPRYLGREFFFKTKIAVSDEQNLDPKNSK